MPAWSAELLNGVPTPILGLGIVSILLVVRIYLQWIDRARYRFLFRRWTTKRLKKLQWEKFEMLTEEILRYQGWRTKRTEGSADGGIDIWARKYGKKRIVQCKRYKDASVTVQVLREQFGILKEHEADEVMIATSSSFTKECYSYTKDKPYLLLDGDGMVALLREIRRKRMFFWIL